MALVGARWQELACVGHILGHKLGATALLMTGRLLDQAQKEAPTGWRWLTPTEAMRLLRATGAASGQGRHLRPLVLTALYTGMRRGELLALRWDNVHLSRAELEVVASKSGYRRTVSLRPEVVDELRRWRRKSREEWVFARSSGEPFSSIRRGFQSAVE